MSQEAVVLLSTHCYPPHALDHHSVLHICWPSVLVVLLSYPNIPDFYIFLAAKYVNSQLMSKIIVCGGLGCVYVRLLVCNPLRRFPGVI